MASRNKKDKDEGKFLLEKLDLLLNSVSSAEEDEARLSKLDAKDPGTAQLQKKAKRKSRELNEQIAQMTDVAFEKAFRSFDLDENESLDAAEIQAACAAAGIPITDRNLQKAMKLLDKNEDGVIDLSEFKGIAIMGHKLSNSDKEHMWKVENALKYASWLLELRSHAKSGAIDVPAPSGGDAGAVDASANMDVMTVSW